LTAVHSTSIVRGIGIRATSLEVFKKCFSGGFMALSKARRRQYYPEIRKWSGAVLLIAILVGAIAQVRAEFYYSMQFYPESGYADCRVHVEDTGDYVAVEVAIFGPDGSILAHDAVASGDYVDDALVTPLVGPGTYRCGAYYYNFAGGLSGQENQYFDVE
jgi:hypothetical protein